MIRQITPNSQSKTPALNLSTPIFGSLINKLEQAQRHYDPTQAIDTSPRRGPNEQYQTEGKTLDFQDGIDGIGGSKYKTKVYNNKKSKYSGKKTLYKAGGNPKQPIEIQEILNLLHIFDRKHDFKIEAISFENLNNGPNHQYISDAFKSKPFKESKIVHDFIPFLKTSQGYNIKDFVMNLNIYYEDIPQNFKLITKIGSNDDTISDEDSKIKQKLKEYIFKNNDTNFYLEDIGVNNVVGDSWNKFRDNILKIVAKKKYPFEKIWDPAGSNAPQDEDICNHSVFHNNIVRIQNIYNKDDQASNEYDYAFRNLTKKHFNISYTCDQIDASNSSEIYKGIVFTLMKIQNDDIDIYEHILKNRYNGVFEYLTTKNIKLDNNNFMKLFTYSSNDHSQFIMYNCGFSINNIEKCIAILEDRTLSSSFLIDDKEYKRSEDIEDVKTVILYFMVYTYLYEYEKLSIDEIKDILYDFKKSGDWGQALCCKNINANTNSREKLCFISGDMFSAFYGILNNVPTIFGSNIPNQDDHSEICIYTGVNNLDTLYIKNFILNYLKNDLIFKISKLQNLDTKFTNELNESINIINKYLNSQGLNNNISFLSNPQNFFDIIFVYENNDNVLKNIFDIIFTLGINIFKYLKNTLMSDENIFDDLENNLNTLKSRYQEDLESIYDNYISNMDIMNDNDKELICYKGLAVFKKYIDYMYDVLYVIYIFYFDTSICSALQIFTNNITNFIINTKQLVTKLQSNIITVKNRGRTQNEEFKIENTKHNWLLDIIRKYYSTINNNNEDSLKKQLVVQFEDKLCKLYKVVINDMTDIFSIINLDIIHKLLYGKDIDLLGDIFKQNIVNKIDECLYYDFNTLQKQNFLNLDEKIIIFNKMMNRAHNDNKKNSVLILSEFLLNSLEEHKKYLFDNYKPQLEQLKAEKEEKMLEKKIEKIKNDYQEELQGLIIDRTKQYSILEYLKNQLNEEIQKLQSNKSDQNSKKPKITNHIHIKPKNTDHNHIKNIKQKIKIFEIIQNQIRQIKLNHSELSKIFFEISGEKLDKNIQKYKKSRKRQRDDSEDKKLDSVDVTELNKFISLKNLNQAIDDVQSIQMLISYDNDIIENKMCKTMELDFDIDTTSSNKSRVYIFSLLPNMEANHILKVIYVLSTYILKHYIFSRTKDSFKKYLVDLENIFNVNKLFLDDSDNTKFTFDGRKIYFNYIKVMMENIFNVNNKNDLKNFIINYKNNVYNVSDYIRDSILNYCNNKQNRHYYINIIDIIFVFREFLYFYLQRILYINNYQDDISIHIDKKNEFWKMYNELSLIEIVTENIENIWKADIKPTIQETYDTLAPATPVPATPIPATPVPTTPVPTTPVAAPRTPLSAAMTVQSNKNTKQIKDPHK